MPFGPARKLDPEQLREYALRLLAGRALSVAEFKQKLRLRALDPSGVDELVAQLKQYDALNDRRYSEHFASSRAESGAYGRQRVLAELLKKKVAPRVAEQAVGQAYAGSDETALVEQWLQKKYRRENLTELLADPKKLASVYRRLRQAGFSTGPAVRVLKRYAAAAEQLEDCEEPPL